MMRALGAVGIKPPGPKQNIALYIAVFFLFGKL
jgi:hypothetical protein